MSAVSTLEMRSSSADGYAAAAVEGAVGLTSAVNGLAPWRLSETVRHDFRGVDGLEVMPGAVDVRASDPGTFRLTLDVVRLGRTVVERYRASRHRGERSRGLVNDQPCDDVVLVVLLDGVASFRQDSRTVDLGRGDVALLRMDAPLQYSLSEGASHLAVTVERDSLGARSTRRLRGATARRLDNPALARVVGMTVSALLEGAAGSRPAGVAAMESTVLTIVETVIAELGSDDVDRGHVDADDALRRRAKDIIAARFRDPAFDSRSVADELGIGIRRAQRLFAEIDTGIAEHIRATRLDAIARVLRGGGGAPLGDIAVENGFAGLPQAGRAFKQRFGETMRDYRTMQRA